MDGCADNLLLSWCLDLQGEAEKMAAADYPSLNEKAAVREKSAAVMAAELKAEAADCPSLRAVRDSWGSWPPRSWERASATGEAYKRYQREVMSLCSHSSSPSSWQYYWSKAGLDHRQEDGATQN